MNTILLVDDDQALSELLCEYLSAEGFAVEAAFNGSDGLAMAHNKHYDLIILDVMLPNMNGIEVLKKMRQGNINTPTLMLTAKGDDVDRILGLELGADDYVPKPCNPRELLARINAILRRSQTISHSIDDQFLIDTRRLEASYQSKPLKLTGAEFKTLESLHQRLGMIVTKETLCEEALGRRLTRYDRSIDVHVSNLRKKLMEVGASADIIINQRGNGYLLKPE
ncbi:response regulator transcription factor [Bermanella sp. WJH001]|uniref:response regulator transcription factor n=1 Tax=Bermanella sp. WJH001 TaxID=3048005 RepID=UPI0024BDE5BA|nr:response regulator transcription factor [Bermanella sp. WJH001]MDJ1538326.1 response regulator transcription factor [Bermanella sp. WJH001]